MNYLLTTLQKFKGMLRGLLVIQLFGAHWMAIVSATDPSLLAKKPIGGLGLAAAAVHVNAHRISNYILLL